MLPVGFSTLPIYLGIKSQIITWKFSVNYIYFSYCHSWGDGGYNSGDSYIVPTFGWLLAQYDRLSVIIKTGGDWNEPVVFGNQYSKHVILIQTSIARIQLERVGGS